MSDYEKNKLTAFATVAVSAAIQEGHQKMQAIVIAREVVMEKTGLTRSKSELACWQAYADIERTPRGFSFDTEVTSNNMLVVNAGDKKIVVTLSELLKLVNCHAESDSSLAPVQFH